MDQFEFSEHACLPGTIDGQNCFFQVYKSRYFIFYLHVIQE